jgi:hypothetical protein
VGLSRVLIDRCRVVRTVAAGARVEGLSPTVPQHGEWLRCRLRITRADESQDPEREGRRAVEAQATVLLQPYANITASDVLEVHSVLGSGRWQVTGAPEQVRASRVRALSVPIARLMESEARRYG